MPYPVTLVAADLGDSPLGTYGCEFNGKLYYWLVNSNVDDVTDGGRLHMYESSDSGLTWTELDTANRPNTLAASTGDPHVTACVDGGTVQFLWTRLSGPGGGTTFNGLTRCTFDLNTKVWTAPANISGSNVDFSSPPQLLMHLITVSSGNYLLFYNSTRASGNARVSFCPYDGTSLGVSTLLTGQSAGQNYIPAGVATDGTHFQFLMRQALFGQNNLYSVGWDGITQGSAVLITNLSMDPQIVSTPILYNNGGDKFAFALWRRVANASPNSGTYVYTSADATTLDATWTATAIHSGPSATDDQIPASNQFGTFWTHGIQISADVGSKFLSVCWCAWLFNSTDQNWAIISAISDCSFAFSAISNLILFSVSPTIFGSIDAYNFPVTGGVGVLGIGQETGSPHEAEAARFYLITQSCGPTIAGNPPNGKVGDQYDFTFTVTGTSPVVTGSNIPDGLTLSSSGELSGIPTLAGTFTGTYTATDSGGSASITRTIVITQTVFTQSGAGGGTGDICCGPVMPRPRCFENVPLLSRQPVVQSFLRKRRR